MHRPSFAHFHLIILILATTFGALLQRSVVDGQGQAIDDFITANTGGKTTDMSAETAIEGKYILTFAEGTAAETMAQVKTEVREAGGEITHEYTIIPGFAAKIPDSLLGKSFFFTRHSIAYRSHVITNIASFCRGHESQQRHSIH